MKHAFSFAASVVFLVGSAAGAEESLSTDELTFFETKIRPVLVRECYGCHSSKAGNVRGGLRLDTKERMLLQLLPASCERWHISSAFTPPENPLAPNSSKLCCTARDLHPGVLYRRAKQPVKYGGAQE